MGRYDAAPADHPRPQRSAGVYLRDEWGECGTDRDGIMYSSSSKRSTRTLPPVPAGTFAVLPLALWARLWSRRSLKRVATGIPALRLAKVFANDA